jgi:hypothetical protein
VATVQFHFLEQGGVALANVRFEAHCGLKSDIAARPKCANIGSGQPSFDHLVFASEDARVLRFERHRQPQMRRPRRHQQVPEGGHFHIRYPTEKMHIRADTNE